jgi:hypothetical protein
VFTGLETVDLATISSLEAGHRVSLPTPCEEVSDLISMAPGSQDQTTRSLEDRASLLKSRRRRQGHMSNFSQERVNSSPQLVFRKHRRFPFVHYYNKFLSPTSILECNSHKIKIHVY